MGLVVTLRASHLPAPSVRRTIRINAGASLRDVGSELGVTAMTVLRWERGETEPRRETAIAYRALLDDLMSVTR